MNAFKASSLMLALALLGTVSVSANELEAETESTSNSAVEAPAESITNSAVEAPAESMTNSAMEAEMEAEMEAAMEDADTVGDSENEVDPELEGPTVNKVMKKAKRFIARKTGHEANEMDNSDSKKSMDTPVKTDEKSAKDMAASKKLDDEIDALLKQIAASANSNAVKNDSSVAG
jgi:hypothetical protein